MPFLTKIFGDANEKYLKKLQPLVEKINKLEPEFENFSNEKLKEKTLEFKERLKLASRATAKGEEESLFSSPSREGCLDDILPEAFALVREGSKRTLGQRHFDVQLIGGIVLHQGKIAEMKTGEGKTLAATLPVYLNGLEEKGVHIVTVNDYLARRDTVWMGQIYHALGLSVGCLNHEQSFLYDPDYKKLPEEKEKMRDELGGFYVVEDFLRPCSRKEAYFADITYGTNNEFGFDYLRNNMVYDLKDQAQRGFHYAIIDEVDSILIDEARTPLIISAPDMESSKYYQEFARIIPKLDSKGGIDYEIDEKQRAVTLTEEGINKIEKILGLENIYEERGMKYLHYMEQGLKARALFRRDRDYVVKDGKVIIIDEFTGRLMPGRRWSGGLHQAIEAKEGVQVQPESLTLATITFQNLFRMYKKLAGMTGTAITSAEEFDKVYGLEVIVIPTNKPMARKGLPDRIYKTKDGKFEALVKEVKERHEKSQPILIGTGIFATGEGTIGAIEKNRLIKKLLEREGIPCQVLDANNDEKEGEIIAQAGRLGAVTVATNMAGRGVDIVLGGNPPNEEEAKKVKELDGLHIIGTERHEARRIDDQLRGRSGRQGDPGSSQFFVSLEDDLLRIFGGDRIKSLMGYLKIPEDQPIEANLISGVIEQAQSKIEGMNFDLRKHILDYDDVMNKHRETIYKKRKEILQASPEQLRERILQMIKKAGYSEEDYEKREREIGEENMRQIEKIVALRTLDMLWMDHLYYMEDLRGSVSLRAYGQRDPLVEYKSEGHKTFQRLLSTIESTIANTILKAQLPPKIAEAPVVTPSAPNYAAGSRNVKKKVGRNDPCPCGKINPKTGKPMKYKKCCYPK